MSDYIKTYYANKEKLNKLIELTKYSFPEFKKYSILSCLILVGMIFGSFWLMKTIIPNIPETYNIGHLIVLLFGFNYILLISLTKTYSLGIKGASDCNNRKDEKIICKNLDFEISYIFNKLNNYTYKEEAISQNNILVNYDSITSLNYNEKLQRFEILSKNIDVKCFYKENEEDKILDLKYENTRLLIYNYFDNLEEFISFLEEKTNLKTRYQ